MMFEARNNGVMRTTPGSEGWIGQLWNADRACLYDTVLEIKPKVIFEVGTWLGGGSTMYMVRAIQKNGFGVLHTSETDRSIYEQAVKNYLVEFPDLVPFVRLYHGDSLEVFPALLKDASVDMVFLDGAEDAAQSVSELALFERHMHPGSVLCMHDWNTEKARLVRPIIETSPRWRIVKVLGLPESVGFVKAIMQ